MKTRSPLGWVILLCALAVPAVLFQRWWTELKQPATFSVQQKEVPPGSAFGEARSDQAGGLGNPIQPPPQVRRPAPGTAPSGPGGVETAQQPSASQAPGQAAPVQRPRASAPPLGAAPQPAAGGGFPQAQAQGMDPGARASASAQKRPRRSGKGAIEYNPKSSRDPMLSLADLRAMAKLKYQRELAQRELIEASRPKPKVKRKVKREKKPRENPCKKIDLQGIVSTQNGSGAIVNDEVRYQGDKVLGLTVKRITTRTVVFTYGRRTACVKRVSR